LSQKIKDGEYRVFVITMEQLGVLDGHMTRFARLLHLSNKKFVNTIKIVHIDELQTIWAAGIAKYGQPAFCPAYGRFNVFRLLFQKSTTVLGFSTTLPPHILSVVKTKMSLRNDHFHIHHTCNRPNIMYATKEIVSSLLDYRNLNLILPTECSSPNQIPLTIVFHDKVKECSDAALYQDNMLPSSMQHTGLIKHYYSYMSPRYLEETYQSFQDPTCRILHTCSGMESGIDFKRADVVIQYGIALDETKTIQCGGRGGRNRDDKSIFLIMYEPWVKELDISKIPNKELQDSPDCPFSTVHKKSPTKQEHTSVQCIKTIQSRLCIRRNWALYLNDETPEGFSLFMPLSLQLLV
jgi:superfamily II DNA helicase RecQ